jgi:hypothetical protein
VELLGTFCERGELTLEFFAGVFPSSQGRNGPSPKGG